MRTQVESVTEEVQVMTHVLPVVDRSLVEQLVGGARAQGIAIDGRVELLAELTKLAVESALKGEMTAHVGYEKHERAGEGGAENTRNGTRERRC